MVNMYIQEQSSGRSPRAAMAWPGEVVFSEGENGGAAGGVGRAICSTTTGLFAVIGDDLVQIYLFGGRKVLGSLSGLRPVPVTMVTDGFVIVITSGSAAYINRKFVISGGTSPVYVYDISEDRLEILPPRSNANFSVSDVDDPFTYQSKNSANAELSTDRVTQIFYFQEKIIMLGTRSVEFFFDDPLGGNPPLKPIKEISTSTLGVNAKRSMAATDDFAYFLGTDDAVHRINGLRIENITPPNISSEIESFSAFDLVGAVGSTIKIYGQSFYILQFPYIELTLCYSESSAEWSRLSSGFSGAGHFLQEVIYHDFSFFIKAGNFMISRFDSNIYRFDMDSYSSDGDPIKRTIVTAPINMSGSRFLCNRVRFLVETGVETTLSYVPYFDVSYSVDGGKTFSNPQQVPITSDESTNGVADWYGVVDCYDLVFKIEAIGEFFFSLHGATANIKRSGY